MHLWANFGARFGCTALLTAFSLLGYAQNAMTPAQALSYRRAADLHLSPDGSKLLYVVSSYQ